MPSLCERKARSLNKYTNHGALPPAHVPIENRVARRVVLASSNQESSPDSGSFHHHNFTSVQSVSVTSCYVELFCNV